MRLIDRYMLREVALTFGYCLLAFIVLRQVFDMFETLRDFLDFHTPPLTVARYYLLLLPGAVEVATPVALFFGLLFALVTLSKNNELLAMRAAGQSVPRICVSSVLLSVVVAGGVFTLSELLVPTAREQAETLHQAARLQRKVEKGMVESMQQIAVKMNLTYVNHREGRHWRFGLFNAKTLSGENVIIQWIRPGQPKQSVNARFAYWVRDHWLFQQVKLITYDDSPTAGEVVAQEYFETWENPAINDSPEDIVLFDKKEPQYMTVPQLHRYLELHPKEELAQIRLNLEQRYAYPWTCVVACLMAIPLGAGMGRRSSSWGVASALGMFMVFFIINYCSISFGKKGTINPVLAAWLANGVFTVVGAVMIWRVR